MASSRNVPLPLALAIVAAAAALLLLSAPSALAGPSAVADARAFWTEERMRQAVPADELVDPVGSGQGIGPAPEGERGTPYYVPGARPGADPGSGLRHGVPAAAPEAVPLKAGIVRELVAEPSARAVRTHGKIFFTIRARRSESKPKMFVCSGTVVTSRVQSLVITAGHCVFDAKGTNRFMDDWVFVPAYSAEEQPFGIWPAKRLATTREWRRDGNIRYDIGAALVARNESGRRIQQVVGARGIAFNQPRRQRYEAFGYPHTDPAGGEFDGSKQYVCRSGMTRRDAPLGGSGPRATQIRCDMTSGSSGGGWVAGNAVHSVTSYSYDSDVTHLYGPYFANTAQNLYKAVRGGVDKRSRRKASIARKHRA